MLIDDEILDDLTARAAESSRLRMNYDLRNSADDMLQRMLNALEPGTVVPKGAWHNSEALESGTVIFEAKDGGYEPLEEGDVMKTE